MAWSQLSQPRQRDNSRGVRSLTRVFSDRFLMAPLPLIPLLSILALGCSASAQGDGDVGDDPNENVAVADAGPHQLAPDGGQVENRDAETVLPWTSDDAGSPGVWEDGGVKPPLVDAATPEDAGADPSPTCTKNQDCGPQEYCSKTACGASWGQCLPRPFGCPTTHGPVCGCEGVTYWNACTAALHGANVDHSGGCTAQEALPCNDQGWECPRAEDKCAYMAQDESICSSPSLQGTCWGLPQSAPALSLGGYRACGTQECTDLFGAITSEVPQWQDPSCPSAR